MPPKDRITKEMMEMKRNAPLGISLSEDITDLYHWTAYINGPTGSPYEGHKFEIDIKIPGDFPFKPPLMTFKTKIYHCNINEAGVVCLDILKDQWSPALTIANTLLSVSSLLSDPNPNDPLVGEIAQLLKTNKQSHDAKAKEYTKKHAIPITK